MGGITRLSKIQMGKETTAGVGVPATVIWRGVGTVTDARVLAAVAEDIGQIHPKDRLYTQYLQADVNLAATEATFEQLPYLLAMGIKGLTTGVSDGDGSGKIYVYPCLNTGVQAGSTYSIEAGDNQDVDQLTYVFCQEFRLTGTSRGGLMMSASLVGRIAADPTTSFTTLTPAPVEEIVFSKGKLYIDDSGGDIGSTQKTKTWLGIDLVCNTGKTPLVTGDGLLTFAGIRDVGPTLSGSITLEHDDTGEAERKLARAKSVRLLKLLWQGSALTTAGTSYSHKTLIFQAAIQYTGVPAFGNQDGDRTVTLPFRVVDSDDIVPTFIVVNELSELS